jgi:hypothetical protein
MFATTRIFVTPCTQIDSAKFVQLFNEYIEMYAARDERLTTRFSQNFTGYPGSGSQLIHNREEWIRITRQDFAQVPGRVRIEMLDHRAAGPQPTDVVVATAFFHIHLPSGGRLFFERRWCGSRWSFAARATTG